MNNFDVSLWYVITMNINNKYETRLVHPWDCLINHVYYLSSAIKIKCFNNFDLAQQYRDKMGDISTKIHSLENILLEYKNTLTNL